MHWKVPVRFGKRRELSSRLFHKVTLLVEPEKDLVYTVDVTLEAVSSELDSTTGTNTDDVEYLGGFSERDIANDAKIMRLFPFVFTIDTRLDTKIYTSQINSDADNNFTIDFGDGTIETRDNATRNIPHTYATDGEYIVKISGKMPKAMRFDGEQKLISIQSGFLENTAPSMQEYFMNCTNLKTIPSNLFANSTAVTNFFQTFRNCTSLTGSIPADLFKYNTKVTTFCDTFRECNNLTGSIPKDLFKTNTLVNNFQSTFIACKSLTGSIPLNLFKYNINVTSFQGTFFNCSGLTDSIPAGLFDNNPLVTNFAVTFYNCSSLTSISVGLFDNNPSVTTFDRAFEGCTGITSALLELWSSSLSSVTNIDTFTGCTQATNLQDAIDNGWATTVTP